MRSHIDHLGAGGSANVCAADAESASGVAQDALEARSGDHLSEARRRDAIATSIAVWLGTMSIPELERVDNVVMQVLRERDHG